MSILSKSDDLTVALLALLICIVPACQVSTGELAEGKYQGLAEDNSQLQIDLEIFDGSIVVRQLGYKFPDGVRANKVVMKTGQPFGTLQDGALHFEFPVLTWLFPSKVAFYEAKVEATRDKLVCTLVRIDTLSAEYESLTTEDIDLAGAMDISDSMLQKYRFILKPVK